MDVHPRLDAWLDALDRARGTDLLLTHGSPPLLRVDGQLGPLAGAAPLDGAEIEAIARAQAGDPDGTHVRSGVEHDFSFTWRGAARVRANAFYQRGTCSVSLRRIPMRIPNPSELGLPRVLGQMLRNPSGLLLVTGPTGSGKSTSQASMIDAVNRERACHLVTIEDPIEYLHTNARSAVTQREVGSDTGSFAHALRSVLREDPDVVLVGEMRDLESISATLTIAETGHLVLATLHTNDSAQAIDRIVDVFPAERRAQIQIQLASTLLGVLYQRLLPRAEGGMVAAYEVLVGIPAVRNLVREGKTRQIRNVVTTHRSDGMQTLEHHLSQLVADRVVDYQAALDASLYPQEIARPAPVAPTPVPVA